jgi:hypothetical protein
MWSQQELAILPSFSSWGSPRTPTLPLWTSHGAILVFKDEHLHTAWPQNASQLLRLVLDWKKTTTTLISYNAEKQPEKTISQDRTVLYFMDNFGDFQS